MRLVLLSRWSLVMGMMMADSDSDTDNRHVLKDTRHSTVTVLLYVCMSFNSITHHCKQIYRIVHENFSLFRLNSIQLPNC